MFLIVPVLGVVAVSWGGRTLHAVDPPGQAVEDSGAVIQAEKIVAPGAAPPAAGPPPGPEPSPG